MARDLNKVLLTGRLGFDPEALRYTPSGSAALTLRLATSESWKDKQTGEKKEHTEWNRIVLYGGLAETAHRYLRKGSKVLVEGRTHTRDWEKEGRTEYVREIIAEKLYMLDSRSSNAVDWDEDSAPAKLEKAQQSDSENTHQNTIMTDEDAFDDDIPF